ncbi:hypothetical protein CDIK_3024 [Cucumispora dikerogammari]|nr:hypothetical protein CDIK_3024 [Cucumispora dikerogammari]
MKDAFNFYKNLLISHLNEYKINPKNIKISSIHEILTKLNIIHKLCTEESFINDLLTEYKTNLNKKRPFLTNSFEINEVSEDLSKEMVVDWAVIVGLGSKKIELNNEGGLPYVPDKSIL